MERTIKFKAKRLDNNEWIEGDLLQVSEKDVQIYNKDCGGYDYPVDPSTVCQFTGLEDKNGKEIWEHDYLIQMVEHEVIYRNGSFQLIDDIECIPMNELEIKNNRLVLWEDVGNKFDGKEEK